MRSSEKSFKNASTTPLQLRHILANQSSSFSWEKRSELIHFNSIRMDAKSGKDPLTFLRNSQCCVSTSQSMLGFPSKPVIF